MPQSEEHPPLGSTFILDYDGGDVAFPIIGISVDPRNGFGATPPTAYEAHPDAAAYPDHVFIGVKPTETDQRSLWTYMILPGPWIYDKPVASDGVLVEVKKRSQRVGDITPSASATVTVEQVDSPASSLIAFEKVTTLASVFPSTVVGTRALAEWPEKYLAGTDQTTASVSAGTTATPTDPTTTGLGVISSQAQRVTEFTVRKEDTARAGTITQLKGQRYLSKLDLVFPFTEDSLAKGAADTSIGSAQKEINPINAVASSVITYDIDAIRAALDGYKLVFPGNINLNLPAQLLSISLVTESQHANGSNNPSGSVAVADTGVRFDVSLGSDSEAQSSGAMMSDLVFDWAEDPGADKPCTHFACYMPIPDGGVLTRELVLAKIKTLVGDSSWDALNLDWPKFHPVSHTIVVTGNAASVRAGATARASRSWSPVQQIDTTQSDETKHISRSVTVKSIHIPACIHGALAIGSAPTPVAISVTANNAVTGTVTDSVTAGPVVISENISCQLSPTSLSATAGASTIPSSGLYVKELSIDAYEYGYAIVTGTIFNFADLLS